MRSSGILAVAMAMACGCAAPVETAENAEQGPEAVASSVAALGDIGCTTSVTVGWNPFLAGFFTVVGSGQLSNPKCPDQLAVQVDGMSGYDIQIFAAPAQIPTMQWYCAASHVEAAVYRPSSSGWTLAGASRMHGVWLPTNGRYSCTYVPDAGYAALPKLPASAGYNGVIIAGRAWRDEVSLFGGIIHQSAGEVQVELGIVPPLIIPR